VNALPRTAARRACVLSLVGALGCGAGTKLAPSPDAAGTSDADAAGTSDADAAGTSDADAACVTGSVTFTLHVAAGIAQAYCLGAPGSCTLDWLSILTADGAESLSLVYGCVPDCFDCRAVLCPLICEVAGPLGDAGVWKTWDGTYVEHLTCGASMACTHPACAPAGNYIARMCAYPEAPSASSTSRVCQGSSTPTCVDVPFTWPPPSGASSVEGVIPAGVDAGPPD
jgi:hypothetical protein